MFCFVFDIITKYFYGTILAIVDNCVNLMASIVLSKLYNVRGVEPRAEGHIGHITITDSCFKSGTIDPVLGIIDVIIVVSE